MTLTALLNNQRNLILLAAGGSFVLLAGAFVFQALGYAPCKLCLWQRWPHAGAIVLGGIALLWPLRILMYSGAALALITGGLGLYHTGIERGFWPGPSSCTGSGPGLGSLSGNDLLSFDSAPAIVMCDQVAWQLLGLSMASYNALGAFLFALLWLLAARRGPVPA
jgi:disulfide bond formation protein DsbB